MTNNERANLLRPLLIEALGDLTPVDQIVVISLVLGQQMARLSWPDPPSTTQIEAIATLVHAGVGHQTVELRTFALPQVGHA